MDLRARAAHRRDHTAGRVMIIAATLAMSLAAASCGSGDGAGNGAAGDVVTDGTPSAGDSSVANGEQLARSSGCAGCHGQDFGGGAGPGLVGLAGSEVPLAGGSTVVADTAYLTRAIANPSADLVADYTLKMPANGLSEAEIADIVAYIESLAAG